MSRTVFAIGILLTLFSALIAQPLSSNITYLNRYLEPLGPNPDSTESISVRDIFADGDYLYGVGILDDGADFGRLVTYDISIPRDITSIGNSLGEYNWTPIAIDVADGYAFIVGEAADGTHRLTTASLTDPAQPGALLHLNSTQNLNDPRDIAVGNGYAYVSVTAESSPWIEIYNVSSPATPAYIGRLDFPTGNDDGFTYRLDADSNYLYIAAGDEGMRIMDIATDPANPTEIAAFNTVDNTLDVVVTGTRAHLADDRDGVRIIDISDPLNMVELGVANTRGSAMNISVNGDLVYTLDQPNGVCIYDISDPAIPQLVGWHNMPDVSSFDNIIARDSLIYLTHETEGVSVFQFHGSNTGPNLTFDRGVLIDSCNTTTFERSGQFWVVNNGFGSLTITDVVASNESVIVDQPGFTIAVGDSELVDVSWHYLNTDVTPVYIEFFQNGSQTADRIHLKSCRYRPEIQVSADTLDFGALDVGDTTELTLTIENIYSYITDPPSNLLIDSMYIGSSAFAFDDIPLSIAANGSVSLPISFIPDQVSSFDDALTIIHNGGYDPLVIPILANGTDPGLVFTPEAVSFGTATVNTSLVDSLTLQNVGAALLTIDSVTSTSGDFTIRPDSFAIAGGGSITVGVVFTPSASGDRVDTLAFHTSNPSVMPLLPVSGGGIIPTIAFHPQVIGFPDAPVGISSAATMTLSISEGTGLSISEVLSDDPSYSISPQSFELSDADSQEVVITFRPISGGDITSDLHFVSAVSGDTQSVEISGTGIANAAEMASFAGSYQTNQAALGITYNDGFAYVASGSGGMQVVDVSSGGFNFTETASFGSTEALNVAFRDDVVYLADASSGMQIVDVADSSAPALVGSYNSGDPVHDIAIRTIFTYLANGDDGMRIVNIDDPANPALFGLYESPGSVQAIALEGNYAYIADGDSGLRVVDLTNLFNPTEVAFLDLAGTAYDIAVEAPYAYLAAGDSGVHIVDISDPLQPTWLSNVATPDSALSLVVENSVVYVAAQDSGMRIIDVADAALPSENGYYIPPGVSHDVAVDNGKVYIAAGDAGVFAVNFDLLIAIEDEPQQLPQSLQLAQNYPNPFNPSTTIAYVLPKQALVSLVIYNALGQRVATLENGIRTAGEHRVVWQAVDQQGAAVGSGIYFYQLRAGSEVLTGKMILIR